jgi:molybdate transport system substrate-binding protein
MDAEILRINDVLHQSGTLAVHNSFITLLPLISMFKQSLSMRFVLFFFSICIVSPLPLRAADNASVNVAVAANFAKPLREIASEFTQLTGVNVVITVSSSGTLFAQIQHGARFDVFLSADRSRPQALVDAQLVHKDNLVNYALGRLAFVYTNEKNASYASHSEISPAQFSKIFESVMSVTNAKLAIANPKLAPYGVAAEQVLASMHTRQLHHQSQDQPQTEQKPTSAMFTKVKGKNVLQTYQFFTTGSVSGALVAHSLTLESEKKGAAENSVLVPSTYYSPIVQSLIVNSKSPAQLVPNVFDEIGETEIPLNKESLESLDGISSSHLFVQYLLSQRVQNRLPGWGYLPAVATAQQISK